MTKRPRSITVIGWLFIAVGSVGLIFHGSEFKTRASFNYEFVWVCLVRLLALIGGALLLNGYNWARWLLGTWMAYHIVLSAFHSPVELLVHILLFGAIGYFLFRPSASAYFHGKRYKNRQAYVRIQPQAEADDG